MGGIVAAVFTAFCKKARRQAVPARVATCSNATGTTLRLERLRFVTRPEGRHDCRRAGIRWCVRLALPMAAGPWTRGPRWKAAMWTVAFASDSEKPPSPRRLHHARPAARISRESCARGAQHAPPAGLSSTYNWPNDRW